MVLFRTILRWHRDVKFIAVLNWFHFVLPKEKKSQLIIIYMIFNGTWWLHSESLLEFLLAFISIKRAMPFRFFTPHCNIKRFNYVRLAYEKQQQEGHTFQWKNRSFTFMDTMLAIVDIFSGSSISTTKKKVSNLENRTSSLWGALKKYWIELRQRRWRWRTECARIT